MRGLSSRNVLVRATATAAAVLLAAGAVGCAGETEIDWPDDPPQSDATGQTSSPADSIEGEVAEEILAIVYDFRRVEAANYAEPQPAHMARRELSGYLADPFLSQTVDTLNDMYQGGVAFQGRQTWAPTVAELRLDETPPSATVRDCVEGTDWQMVFRDTGEPVPGDTIPARYIALIEVKQYPDGWLVERIDITQEEQC